MATKHYKKGNLGIAKKKCPILLEALLDLLNQLPEELKSMATYGFYDGADGVTFYGFGVLFEHTSTFRGVCTPSDEQIEEMAEILDMLPRSETVWPGSTKLTVAPHDQEECRINGKQLLPLNHPQYEEAREYFLFLLAAFQVCWQVAQGYSGDISSTWLAHSDLRNSLRIDSDGLIKENSSRLHSFFVGVEASRIRLCKACKNLYWAVRLHRSHGGSSGCSPRCNNALRVDKWRKKHAKKTQQAKAYYG